MNASDLVSVVITTYNRSDALLAVLAGLTRQNDRHFEVIVADDGSREEHLRPVIESDVAKALGLVHVWHPDVGFTAARIRNRGVAASSSPYVILLDGDCVPELDFIAQHKKLAQSGYFVNGSRVLLSAKLTQRVLAGAEQICGRSTWYWLKQLVFGHASKFTHLLRLSDGPQRLVREFSWKGIRSCNMGVWKTDFEQVDGFDESFVGWGHEDADFILRLHHSGVMRKNGYCATEVFHLWHEQARRNKASQNALLVQERVKTGLIQSTLGYSQAKFNDNDNVLITRL